MGEELKIRVPFLCEVFMLHAMAKSAVKHCFKPLDFLTNASALQCTRANLEKVVTLLWETSCSKLVVVGDELVELKLELL